MKVSISNLGWNPALNNQVYTFLQARGAHIEVAPSIIMPWEENRTTAMFIGPYDRLGEASQWYRDIHSRFGLNVSSMQSVLYRITENIFGDKMEYIFLRNYMYKAVDFAAEIKCGNIVFGCPKNRVIPGSMDSDTAMGIARNFFKAVGDYAYKKGVFTGLEANAKEDGTNFINTTAEAFEFVKSAGSEGLKVNVDLGTIIRNGEALEDVFAAENIPLISHVHISMPGLKVIEPREEYERTVELLKGAGYDRYISIEMLDQKAEDIGNVEKTVNYLAELVER